MAERKEQVGVVRDDNHGQITEVKVDQHILDPNDPRAVQVPAQADGTRRSALRAVVEGDEPTDRDRVEAKADEDAARGRVFQDNTLNPQRVHDRRPSEEDVSPSKSSSSKSSKSDKS